METAQLPKPPAPSSRSEAFFPKAHPHVSWALVPVALAVCWAALFCPSPLGRTVAQEFLDLIFTLIPFYLICWWLAGENKERVRGLVFHTCMLAVAEFVVWGLFELGHHGETAEMVLAFINFAVYAVLAQVLYGFTPLRSLAVMGLMLLATFTCGLLFVLLALLLDSPALVL